MAYGPRRVPRAKAISVCENRPIVAVSPGPGQPCWGVRVFESALRRSTTPTWPVIRAFRGCCARCSSVRTDFRVVTPPLPPGPALVPRTGLCDGGRHGETCPGPSHPSSHPQADLPAARRPGRAVPGRRRGALRPTRAVDPDAIGHRCPPAGTGPPPQDQAPRTSVSQTGEGPSPRGTPAPRLVPSNALRGPRSDGRVLAGSGAVGQPFAVSAAAQAV